MRIDRVIEREMNEKGNGDVKVIKVPPEKKPTAESLFKLDREIKSQIDANNAMVDKSIILAKQTFI